MSETEIMMKKNHIVIILLLFHSLIIENSQASQTKQPLSDNSRPIIILNSAADAPFTTESRDGFLDELAKKMFNKIGYKLIIEVLPPERALKSANSGLIDGEIIRVAGIDKVYPNLIPVSDNMMTMEFVAFAKKPIDIKSGWSALQKKEVAFITGWKIYEKRVPKTAYITNTNNTRELFILLKKERIDIVLHTQWGGAYMINKLQIKNTILLQPTLATKKMFMYLHNKHKLLVPKLTAVLTAMKNNGSYQKLVTKHLVPFR